MQQKTNEDKKKIVET